MNLAVLAILIRAYSFDCFEAQKILDVVVEYVVEICHIPENFPIWADMTCRKKITTDMVNYIFSEQKSEPPKKMYKNRFFPFKFPASISGAHNKSRIIEDTDTRYTNSYLIELKAFRENKKGLFLVFNIYECLSNTFLESPESFITKLFVFQSKDGKIYVSVSKIDDFALEWRE